MRKLVPILAVLLLFAIPARAQSSPTYFYTVTAVDANGFESVQPASVSAVFGTGKHIAALTWTAPTIPAGGAAIAGYNVYRGTAATGPFVKVNSALVTGVTTYSDSFTLPNAPSGLAVTVQ